MCKTEKIKDETSKKVRETSGGQWDFLLLSRILFRCLIFNCYNIIICKKKLKDEASKNFVKPMEVKSRSKFPCKYGILVLTRKKVQEKSLIN